MMSFCCEIHCTYYFGYVLHQTWHTEVVLGIGCELRRINITWALGKLKSFKTRGSYKCVDVMASPLHFYESLRHLPQNALGGHQYIMSPQEGGVGCCW